jgi:hypothetical protein
LLVLFKAFACLVVSSWSPWISLAVFCVQVRNYFLLPVRVGFRTEILRLR